MFGSDAGHCDAHRPRAGAGGEFGFVLLVEAGQARLLAPQVQQIVLAAVILSMLASPFIIERSEHMVRRFSGADWMYRAMALHTIAAQTMAAEGHVIICGYGRSGQNLARLLEREEITYIALDLDPERVQRSRSSGRERGVRRCGAARGADGRRAGCAPRRW